MAVDFGDLEMRDDEPVGPPLARAARLVAVAHPGQVLLSSAAHDALTAAAEAGWGAESLGRFDIVGLDPGIHVYQLVGHGFGSDFPALRVDRLPPPVPSGPERSVPGYELRALIGVGELGEVHRAYQPSVGREVAVRIFGPRDGRPSPVRAPVRDRVAAHHPGRASPRRSAPRLLAGARPGGDGEPADDGRAPRPAHPDRRPGRRRAALAVFEPVAAGVASAHRRGVVHGRIRPENVLFDEEGNAYVADLGVDEICAGVITFATSAYDAAGAPRWRPRHSGGGRVLPRRAGAPPARRLSRHRWTVRCRSARTAQPAVVGRATDPDPARRHGSVDELVSELRDALAVPADPTAVFVPTRNPYRGLESFEQADAEDFFGRDRAVAEMVESSNGSGCSSSSGRRGSASRRW